MKIPLPSLKVLRGQGGDGGGGGRREENPTLWLALDEVVDPQNLGEWRLCVLLAVLLSRVVQCSVHSCDLSGIAII